MSREVYIRRLDDLRRRIALLGEDVDKAIRLSVACLKHEAPVLADSIIRDDENINRARLSLEEDAATLIATEQPVAGDLRLILGGFIVVTELERMGDHAKGTARIAKMLKGAAPEEAITALTQMADLARDLLQKALVAFATSDDAAARRVAAADEDLDRLYEQFYVMMLAAMHDGRVPIETGMHLLWVSHNLERIGDRTSNICERTIYVATGAMVELRGHLPIN